MAVPIALVIGFILGYRAYGARWPFLLAAASVIVEIIVNGVRFGFQTVTIWGVVLTALTLAAAIGGLRLGGWVHRRTLARTNT